MNNWIPLGPRRDQIEKDENVRSFEETRVFARPIFESVEEKRSNWNVSKFKCVDFVTSKTIKVRRLYVDANRRISYSYALSIHLSVRLLRFNGNERFKTPFQYIKTLTITLYATSSYSFIIYMNSSIYCGILNQTWLLIEYDQIIEFLTFGINLTYNDFTRCLEIMS